MNTKLKNTKNILVALSLILVVISGLPSEAQAVAGVPKILSHQGRLLDSSENLLGGSGTDFCFKFAIYDDATVGSPDTKLWPSATSSIMTVNVKNGVFNVGIGDTSAGGDTLDFNFQDNDTVYLNVEVATLVGGDCTDGDETFENLNPRQQLFSSGYAINASTVGGFTPSQLASSSQIPVLTSGNLILGGTNPQVNATSTNTLTLQGGTGTGDIQFFSSSNKITSSGNISFAGILQAAGTGNSYIAGNLSVATTTAPSGGVAFFNGNVGIGTSSPATALHVIGNITASGGLTFVNATGTGNLQIATLVATGDSSLQGVTFSNATGTGNLQTATLNITSQSTLASASSTNLEASGYLVIGGNLTVSGTSALQGATFTNATGTTLALTGLTAGSALFVGSGGIISEDNANFFWDDTNNRLGIGTATPAGTLHVSNVSSSNALVVATSGNVGIGIAGPFANLAIGTTKDSADDSTLGNWPLLIQNFANDTGEELGIGFRTSNVQASNNVPGGGITFERTAGNSVGSLHFKTSPSVNVLTTRMTIDSAGNVGIGDTAPDMMLHIEGADPEIYLHGTSGDAFESGRIRFAEKTAGGSNNFKGGFIHFDGSANVFNIGVHDPGDQTTSNDVNAISIDRTTAYVGIGTSTPGAPLTLVGTTADNTADFSITSNDALISLGFGASGPHGIAFGSITENGMQMLYRTALDEIVFEPVSDFSNGTDLMVIEAGGNVGIGTASPLNKLHVEGGIQLASTTPATTTFALYNQGGSLFFNGSSVGGGGSASGTAGLIQFSDGSSGFDASSLFFWDNTNSRLGVGTSTPAGTLHVSNASSSNALVVGSNGNVGIGASDLRSAFEVVSSNNVLADLAAEENYHLKIRNPNNTNGEGVGISFGMSSTNSQQTGAIVAKRTGGNGQGTLQFYTKRSTTAGVAPVFAMIIDQSGNVGIGETSPADLLDVDGDIRVGSNNNGCVKDGNGTVIAGTCSSDAALKKNVVPLSGVLEKLIQIEPVTFNWRAEEFPEYHFGTATSTGLIAQNVEEYFPQYVSVDKHGHKTVNFSVLPMLLIQGMREQQEQIRALQFDSGQALQLDSPRQDSFDITQDESGQAGQVGTSSQGVDAVPESDSLGNALLTDIRETVQSVLASLGFFIENGIAKLEELTTRKIVVEKAYIEEAVITKAHIQNLEVSERIQLRDQATDEAYCTWIENGEWIKRLGGCSNEPVGATESLNVSAEANSSETSSSTEDLIIVSQEETAMEASSSTPSASLGTSQELITASQAVPEEPPPADELTVEDIPATEDVPVIEDPQVIEQAAEAPSTGSGQVTTEPEQPVLEAQAIEEPTAVEEAPPQEPIQEPAQEQIIEMQATEVISEIEI